MPAVTFAFNRWLAAEQDVHDANLLLIDAARRHDLPLLLAQQNCVSRLRRDASRCLSDYLEEAAQHTRHLARKPAGGSDHLHYFQLPDGD